MPRPAADTREFNAKISAWVKQSDARMRAVFQESTKRVISEAQRLIPVDTGFARASIRASLESMPQINGSARPIPGSTYNYDEGQVAVVIANAKLGDKIYVGWTASYAIYLEYGHSQQAPSGFVRVAALQWRTIVSEVSAELKTRVTGIA
jgi:hypothetical protein